MPVYLYACDKKPKKHPTQEVNHRMSDSPDIRCTKCGGRMHKRPQSMRFSFSPFDVLTSWSNENWRRYKARSRGYKAPRFSPDVINMPESGIPQKEFNTRRYNKS